jgi:hypothetical protein
VSDLKIGLVVIAVAAAVLLWPVVWLALYVVIRSGDLYGVLRLGG